MTKWQSIETGPKDGTRVLLFIPGWKVPVQVGYYWDCETREYGIIKYTREEWSVPGMTSLFGDKPLKPTHWMPLPDGPNALD